MIDDTVILLFGMAGMALWYLGISGRDVAKFRILFISFGFLMFMGAFSALGMFLSAFVQTGVYTAAAVNSFAPIAYAFMYAMIIGMFIYLAIELAIYLGRIATLIKKRKDNPYAEAEEQ